MIHAAKLLYSQMAIIYTLPNRRLLAEEIKIWHFRISVSRLYICDWHNKWCVADTLHGEDQTFLHKNPLICERRIVRHYGESLPLFCERVSPAETAGDLCERDMLNGINGERRGLYYDGNSLSYTHQAASGGVQLSSLVSAVVPELPWGPHQKSSSPSRASLRPVSQLLYKYD